MSHKTAATALLLASLPYGLALPQVIPLLSELAANVTPTPLPLVPVLNASTVTVVGTIVQPAVESAVEDVTDAIEDAAETIASVLKSTTDAFENVLPTGAPSILDPEANILPLILPGILPVETELPPVDAPDVEPSDLPDTNDLEVIDLPAPIDEPYDEDGLIAEPYFPDFPDEATVPISTFNAVVQPLLSVIQTLLNSLPGNFAPALPGIFPHPLLPSETPEIFIDPLLPTETFDDTVATATDTLIDPLVDPIPTNSIAVDLPFAKRQEVSELDTNSIYSLIAPILEAIKALVAQIPTVSSEVSDAVSNIEAGVSELPFDVPSLPVDAPLLPTPDTTLPDLVLPPVTAPDALPTDELPVDVPAPVLPVDVPAPVLPVDVPAPVLPVDAPVPVLPELPLTTPPALSDLTSGIPDEVLNAPFPDDIEGIDWAAYESPPFWVSPEITSEDVAIPDDILNVPVPDFDENGIPIDPLVGVVPDATAITPAALPTSLDAFGDWSDDLQDWPFSDIPEFIAPDESGELPDLDDLPIPDDVLNVPVPDLDDLNLPLDLPTDVAGSILADPLPILPIPTDVLDVPVPTDLLDALVPTDVFNVPVPTDLLDALVPTDLLDVPVPTDLLDVPVPTDLLDALVQTDLLDVPVPTDLVDALVPTDVFDVPVPTDLLDVPVPTDLLDVPVPTDLLDVPVPTDLLDVPVPTDLLDVPVPTDLLDVPVPTDLFDVPVPDDFEDIAAPTEIVTALPAPSLDSFIPDDILNIPWPELDENGIPIDLPVDSLDDLAAPPAALPTNLNWWDIPVPDDWIDEDEVPSILPAAAAPTDIIANILPASETSDDLSALAVSDLPAPALPVEAFGAGFPIQALPDVPLILPTSELPVEDLLPVKGPAALTDIFTDVPTDALSGLPTSDPVDVLPVPTDILAAAPAITGLVTALPTLSVPTDALAAAPALATPVLPVEVPVLAAPALPVAAPAVAAPVPILPAVAAPALPVVPAAKLPLQVPGARGPIGKRQLPDLFAPVAVTPVATPAAGNPVDAITISLIKPLLKLVSALLAKLPRVGQTVPNIGATLPDVSTLVPAISPPTIPAVPNVAAVLSTLPASDLVSSPPVAKVLPAPVPAGLLPNLGGKLEKRQLAPGGLLGSVPVLGGLGGTATGAVRGVPGIAQVESTVAGTAPKVPLAFDSGLTKSLIPADLPIDPATILAAIKPVLSIIELLVASLSLPTAGVPLAKRDADALHIDPELFFTVISPLLQVSNRLVELTPGDESELPAVTNIISGLQKRGVATELPELSAPLDISVILAVIKPLLELVTGLFTKLPGPVSSVVSTSPVNSILGNLPLGKRDTASIPGLDILTSILEPLLALVNSLLAKSPIPLSLVVPDVNVNSIVGSLTKRQLETVTNSLDPTSTVNLVQSLLQTILGLLNALPVNPATILPKLPLTGLGRRDLDSIPLKPNEIVGLVKPILELITSLLKTLVPTVSNAVSSLPIPVKRQVLGTGITPAAITSTVAPLQSLIDPSAVLDILPPLLRVLGQLIAGLPLSAVQQVPLVNTLGNLGKRQLGGTPASANQALSLLPGLLNLLSGLLGSLNLPVNPGPIVVGAAAPVLGAVTAAAAPALNVVAPVAAPALAVAAPLAGTAIGAGAPLVGTIGGLTGGAAGLGGLGGGLTKTLPVPVNLPLARRAIETFQQGPASDWEAFLGELDEWKQPELAGLIQDSAKAVNNGDLDTMSGTIMSDIDELSAETKSALLEGFGATTFGKRSIRYAKRQQFAGVPGVLSIGPDLDDAKKIDISGFNLDPNNQLNGLAAGGSPVDSDHPPPPNSVEQFAGPSVSLGDPELLDILAGGGLDPNNMRSRPLGGAPVDDVELEDPYADVRQNFEPAFGASKPLEGLDATIQAAKNNHFSGRKPSLSWVPQTGGSAALQQAQAAAKQQAGAAAQQQNEVLHWFQRFVRPSWNKDVDAEIVR